jgi:hypothetical protein
MIMANEPRQGDPTRHRGPSLVVVAATHFILFAASVLTPVVLAGSHFPSPFEGAEQSTRYFGEHSTAVQVAAFLQFGAAVPLGIFAASATSRVQFLGMKVAGINIAFFGGVVGSACLMLSGFCTWVLSQPVVTESVSTTRAFQLLCFAAGGPGVVVPLGLLISGLAVVGGLQGFVPRWMMTSGLGIAAIAEVSAFTLVVPMGAYLLPIARFTALIWMILAGALLPKTKGVASRRRGASPALLPDAAHP